MNPLPELIQSFQDEVPGFISADIVEIETGMSIGGGTIDPEFDSEMASASYAEVVKSNRRALSLLGMPETASEDVLITTKDAYLLIRELGTSYYLGLVISKDGNLGMARMLTRRYADKFLKAIEGE